MRLTVIGCSPAWPNAGGAHPGYLVEGDGRLLLDCGPGVLARLRAAADGWPSVDAVVITHFHLDHWGDLVPWIFGANFGPGRGIPKPELWLPPQGIGSSARATAGDLSFGERIDGAFDPDGVRGRNAVPGRRTPRILPFRLDHYWDLDVRHAGDEPQRARLRTRATRGRATKLKSS